MSEFQTTNNEVIETVSTMPTPIRGLLIAVGCVNTNEVASEATYLSPSGQIPSGDYWNDLLTKYQGAPQGVVDEIERQYLLFAESGGNPAPQFEIESYLSRRSLGAVDHTEK